MYVLLCAWVRAFERLGSALECPPLIKGMKSEPLDTRAQAQRPPRIRALLSLTLRQ